jgi:hypothetical protein
VVDNGNTGWFCGQVMPDEEAEAVEEMIGGDESHFFKNDG